MCAFALISHPSRKRLSDTERTLSKECSLSHLPVCPPPHPFFFTSLCITGCFLSPLSGSENHRNKLQGMMSDFPSKPAKPPSVSGQARSGEGKTSPVTLLSDLNPRFTGRHALAVPYETCVGVKLFLCL